MDKNKIIAEVPEYHLNKKNLKKGLKYVYMRGYKIIVSFFMFFMIAGFGAVYYYINIEKYTGKKIYVIGCFIIVIIYLLFSFFMFKIKIITRAAKIMKSIPNNLLGLTVSINFYLDRVEFDSDEASGSLKYEDFYKILKLDDGYLFLTTKKVFHYFEFSEIKTVYNIDYLDSVLIKYYK